MARLRLGSLTNAYLASGQIKESYGALAQVIALGPGQNFVTSHVIRVFVAAWTGDEARLTTFLEAVDAAVAAGSVSDAHRTRITRNLALLRGQLRHVDELNDRLLTLASRRTGEAGANELAELAANMEALDVNLGRAPRHPIGSASATRLRDYNVWALAWTHAFGSDAVMADRFADEADRRHTLEGTTRLARAAALFAGGQLHESRLLLDKEAEVAGNQPMIYAFRGRVRQAQGDRTGARADYHTNLQRKFYDAPAYNNFIGFLFVQQTQIIAAELAHELGDDAEARRLYDDLLKQWKDADKDFPLLLKVNAGLAKLGK